MINSQNKDLKLVSQNKILRVVGNIGFTIFMITMSLLIFITAQSRLTGREPALLNHRIYIVESGSMSPTLQIDSMILVKEMSKEEIKSGDIITYYSNNGDIRVTHRVVEVINNGENFITRGDANNVNDPSLLDGNKVIGKVITTIPLVGKIFKILSTRLAMALIISMGILWIIIPKIFPKQSE